MQKISFEADILPLKDKLFRIAYRITMHREEAEDLVQDTMLKVWSKKEEWDAYESIEAFCITVVRNLALDRIEKKDFRADEWNDQLTHTPDTDTPASGIEREEQYNIVEQLIAHLPEQQRTIVQLREMEGMSYREIANSLQMTEEQVKINLYRVRQKLKTMYERIANYGL